MRIILISNMYPSNSHPRYGIFVKNFETMISKNFIVSKRVMVWRDNVILKLLEYLKTYFKVLIDFLNTKEQIYYFHFPLYFSPIIYLSCILGKKIVINFHGSDLVFDSKLKRFLSHFLFKKTNGLKIVVPSAYYRKKLIDDFEISKEKIFVFPSGGIDLKIFRPDKTEGSDKEFVLGFVSNLIESKGWRIFLNVAKELKDENKIQNLKLVMVGDGPDYHNAVNMSKSYDLQVKFYSKLSQVELSSIYNTLNLFVFPTYREAESLGLVGLEALACGVPVIASKVGGPMGYITDAINGFLFEKRNETDLKNCIYQYFYLTEEEKVEMMDNSVQSVKNYSKDVVSKDLLDFLNSISHKE